MSQPSPYPSPGPYVRRPAAATQIVVPGQLPAPPQPQFAPTPEQAETLQGGPLATGFPNYRPPAPSPRSRTGLVVGILVVLLVALFAVGGFWLVS